MTKNNYACFFFSGIRFVWEQKQRQIIILSNLLKDINTVQYIIFYYNCLLHYMHHWSVFRVHVYVNHALAHISQCFSVLQL